jgi:hypothetical protein
MPLYIHVHAKRDPVAMPISPFSTAKDNTAAKCNSIHWYWSYPTFSCVRCHDAQIAETAAQERHVIVQQQTHSSWILTQSILFG